MRPTEDLRAEHEAIERLLRVLDEVAERLGRGAGVPGTDLEAMLEFLRVFADQCHHGKEETLLFPALEQAGLSRERGPIAVMLAEHTQGRAHVRAIGEALPGYKRRESAAREAIGEHAQGYVGLLAQHIQKENQVLFPLADQRLNSEQQAEMMEGFERIERDVIGPGRHEAFHALLHRLEETYLGEAHHGAH